MTNEATANAIAFFEPCGEISDVVQRVGFDLPCGAGHLGLQGAPGALPRALGFESLRSYLQKRDLRRMAEVPLLAQRVGFPACGRAGARL